MSRDSFSSEFIVPEGIYALAHSVGPITQQGKHSLQSHYLSTWEHEGGDAWPAWLSVIQDFSEQLSTLLNCQPSELCPKENLASGFFGLLSALVNSKVQTPSKKVILMHKDAFASMGFVVQGMKKRYGLQLKLIDAEENNLDAWQAELEKDNVLACLFTHVHSNTSYKSDVKNLCRLAREYDAFSMIDIAQSVGIVPVDLHEFGTDAAFGSCVKWLCSGPGAGFMYVKESHIHKLETDAVGWFSHENPFEFDISDFRYSPDAKRFWGGTPSVAPYAIASGSLRTISKIGIDTIAAHCEFLRKAFFDVLAESKWRDKSISLINKRGGTLCLPIVGDHNLLAKMLKENAVRSDMRGSTLRLSLHIYNSVDDAQALADLINAFNR